jgi:mono/diheme cytochrome c family protein
MRIAAGIAAAVLIFAGIAFVSTLRYGFSALDEPTRLEAAVARAARHWAAPSDLRGRKNPVPLTPQVLAEARAHFADHCAVCHGNDGKGESGMGKQMYPKTPDMTRAATQQLSDGELFSVIENGVRLTGMPGFGNGTAESAAGSWPLVHFIRHLPKITPEELGEMEKLNPKSPEEWRQMQEEAAFLAGADAPPGPSPAPAPTMHSQHSHQH